MEPPGAAAEDLPAMLERIRSSERAGDRVAADAALASAIDRWPDRPNPWLLSGRLKRSRLDFGGAAADLARAAGCGATPERLPDRADVELLAARLPRPPTEDDLDEILDLLEAELGDQPQAPTTPNRWCVIHGALHTGGATRLIEELVEVLVDAGREVIVLVSHLEGHGALDRRDAFEAAGVTVQLWGDPVDDGPTVLGELSRWGDVRPLRDRLHELAPERVQVTGSALLLALAGTIALRSTGATVALRVGMEAPVTRAQPAAQAQVERNLVVRGMLRRALRDPRCRYEATSQVSRSGHQAWLGPDVAVGFLPTVVDERRLRAWASQPIELPWPRGALVLGGVMRLDAVKRPGLFAEVAKRVVAARPDVHVCLVGDGDRTLLGDAPAVIGDHWHHVGYQLRPEPWIAALDLNLITSATEGMPTVVLEAAALGVPSICADVGGSAESLEHGVTGSLVTEVDDPDAYVAAALALVDDPQRRRAMGAAAPGWIAQRYAPAVLTPLLLR